MLSKITTALPLNRVVVILTALANIAAALVAVAANLDLPQVVTLLGTFASVDAKVLSWIKGWQSYEAAIYTSNLTKQANADRQAAVAAATAPASPLVK